MGYVKHASKIHVRLLIQVNKKGVSDIFDTYIPSKCK